MYNMFTPTAPLGGYKDSWYGRDLGKEALLGNTQEHQEYYRAIPSISMPSPPLNLRLAPEQFAYVINHAQDKVIIDSTPLPLLAQGGESFGFPPLVAASTTARSVAGPVDHRRACSLWNLAP